MMDIKLKRYYIEKLQEAEEITLLAFPKEHEPEKLLPLIVAVFHQISEHEHYVQPKLANIQAGQGAK